MPLEGRKNKFDVNQINNTTRQKLICQVIIMNKDTFKRERRKGKIMILLICFIKLTGHTRLPLAKLLYIFDLKALKFELFIMLTGYSRLSLAQLLLL